MISLTVNGQLYQVEVEPGTLLLDLLREKLALRGTKYGCGEGECGACTVIMDGRSCNACLVTAGQAHGREIITIEGLAQQPLGAELLGHFSATGAVQCGFCTPGFVMSAWALLAENPRPRLAAIRQGLSGNLCRCTGYRKIIEAVEAVAGGGDAPGPPPAEAKVRPTLAPSNSYARPASLEAALQLLAEPEAGWRIIAGGTDLLVRFEHRLNNLRLLDLSRIEELAAIWEDETSLHVGALTSYSRLIRAALVRRWAPALVTAAGEVGGGQIQNMGTVGGNLANASPAGDTIPPLMVLEAAVVLRSSRGRRVIPLAEFALGPGQTVLAPDELIQEIIIPKRQHPGQEITFFDKVGPRQAQSIAIASLAGRGWLVDGRLSEVRIALGAVGPTVLRAYRSEAELMAGPFAEARLRAAAEAARAESRPIDDIRASAGYRRQLVAGMLIRQLWPYLP
jgi:xanthine dehydrogenase small subunit